MAEDVKDKKPVGRPPIHTDPTSLERLVKDYFEYIEGEEGEREVDFINSENEKETIRERYWIRKPEPPTVTGLTIHLGFSHKSSLYEYAEKEQFTDSIKKGLTLIEKYHEIKAAYGDKCVGNIFVLKNFGWKDSQSID